MTAQGARDEIVGYHGAMAGAIHRYRLNDEYLQWLVGEVLGAWRASPNGCRCRWFGYAGAWRVPASGACRGSVTRARVPLDDSVI